MEIKFPINMLVLCLKELKMQKHEKVETLLRL